MLDLRKNFLAVFAGGIAILAVVMIADFMGYELTSFGRRIQPFQKTEPKPELKADEARKPEEKRGVSKADSKVETGGIPSADAIAVRRKERTECEIVRTAEITESERKVSEAEVQLVDCLADAKLNFLFRSTIESRCESLRKVKLALEARLAVSRQSKC